MAEQASIKEMAGTKQAGLIDILHAREMLDEPRNPISSIERIEGYLQIATLLTDSHVQETVAATLITDARGMVGSLKPTERKLGERIMNDAMKKMGPHAEEAAIPPREKKPKIPESAASPPTAKNEINDLFRYDKENPTGLAALLTDSVVGKTEMKRSVVVPQGEPTIILVVPENTDWMIPPDKAHEFVEAMRFLDYLEPSLSRKLSFDRANGAQAAQTILEGVAAAHPPQEEAIGQINTALDHMAALANPPDPFSESFLQHFPIMFWQARCAWRSSVHPPDERLTHLWLLMAKAQDRYAINSTGAIQKAVQYARGNTSALLDVAEYQAQQGLSPYKLLTEIERTAEQDAQKKLAETGAGKELWKQWNHEEFARSFSRLTELAIKMGDTNLARKFIEKIPNTYDGDALLKAKLYTKLGIAQIKNAA